MDPSSNNNPQYYPPPQQNYPTQQAYPTNAYQSPPTQQGYPSANPYPPQESYPTQQGYTHANPFQSPQQGYPPQYDQQQPQILDPTQNLDQLDQGVFQCYKVALGFVILLELFQFLTAFTYMMGGGGYALYGLILFLCALSMIALVVRQFLAMKDRDLQKAKIALIGFLSVVSLILLSQVAFSLAMFGSQSSFFQLIISLFIGAAIYGGLTLVGSFKVYQLLNESQIKTDSDIYQNQNQDQNQNQTQNYYQA